MPFWTTKNLPKPFFPEKGADLLETLITGARDNDTTGSSSGLSKRLEGVKNKALVQSLGGNSYYLSHLMTRHPEFLKQMFDDAPEKLLDDLLKETEKNAATALNEQDLMALLRHLKARAALLIAACDVSVYWELEQVTKALSNVADLSLQLSLAFLLHQKMSAGDIPWPSGKKEPISPALARKSGFVILSLGKLGARSLNYSSDIDIIMLYDEVRVRYKGNQTPKHLFTRLAQNIVRFMHERTADGYVFRTDLRLRPDPGTTPPAVSIVAAEVYYQSLAETWERAAMIKVRVSAGDKTAGADFLSRLRNFIWRKHLDFAAIRDIHAIKERIHNYYGQRTIFLPGHNIKVGEGGIRSIEFFCQIHQLIAGGRNRALRKASTQAALKALEGAHVIDHTVSTQLAEAYKFLRTVEHRLQMIDDEQTQKLPTTKAGMAHLATFMGFKDADTFQAKLMVTLSIVKRHYDSLPGAEEKDSTPAFLRDKTLLTKKLASLGFSETGAETVMKWRNGNYKALKNPRARKILDSLLPELLESFSLGANQDQTLSHFDDFLSKLPSGVQILSLFQNNPWVFQLIGKIVIMAPSLASELARRPDLLDFVLDPTFFEALVDKTTIEKSYQAAMADCRDYQDTLEASRKWLNEMRFQAGVHLLESLISVPAAGVFLANLAEVIVARLLQVVKKDFAFRNGIIKNSEMAVIALGSFGGRELTHGSDLDLVLLYDAPDEARSSKGKNLSASQYFIRLGQHFLTALGAMMGAGKLFDVDLRLRPSGRWGPLVVTLEAFRDYQAKQAWSWEHMALTRARVISATPAFRNKIERIIRDILAKKRTPAKLAKQMDEVRMKYFEEFGSDNTWSVRHVRGGLIDIEYVLQFHLLRQGHKHPEIFDPDFRIAVQNLIKAKAITRADGAALQAAHDLLLEVRGYLRLCHQENEVQQNFAPALLNLMAGATNSVNADVLVQQLVKSENAVYALYQKHISRYVKGG